MFNNLHVQHSNSVRCRWAEPAAPLLPVKETGVRADQSDCTGSGVVNDNSQWGSAAPGGAGRCEGASVGAAVSCSDIFGFVQEEWNTCSSPPWNVRNYGEGSGTFRTLQLSCFGAVKLRNTTFNRTTTNPLSEPECLNKGKVD